MLYANLQQPISRGNNMREFEEFSHFFSIIEENFEKFGNVFGKNSKFYEILCQEPIFYDILCIFIFSKNFMIFYDFMPSGTPVVYNVVYTV